MAALVTLTTDFGTRDAYAAAMKGVLHRLCPHVTCIDMSHDISPHDIVEGALFLAGAVPPYPAGTIHVAVIDPGVGTARRPIAAEIGGQWLVCPDNGLVTLVARVCPLGQVRHIINPSFMAEAISPTFHGRDVFAPTAAHLAGGAQPADLGPIIEDIALLDIPRPTSPDKNTMRGEIIHIDRFGNLITNIHRTDLGARTPKKVVAGEIHVNGLHTTYGQAPQGTALALFGSSDYLEVAVNLGNAAQALGLTRQDPVTIQF